ncbi:PAS domain-containing protein [Brevundimonas sp.]|uniref:PAS domain-containing protein n=1 Tax=Brevundimonas sp. TaxID=1871086 RepID=UPI00289E2BF6|nr:PAS domain-containing protein [Brevundimonas sp.]
MINAMAEGFEQAAGRTDGPNPDEQSWLIRSVELLLRQAFPTFIVVGRGEATYFNAGFRDLLLSPSAIQGAKVEDVAPSLAAQLSAAFERGWADEQTSATDLHLHVDRPGGAQETWLTVAITPVSRGGKPLALLGVCRDVTEERSLRARLNTAESRLQSLADIAPLFLWRLDARGVVRWMNTRAQTYLGVGLAQAKAQGWVGWLHPTERDQVVATWGRSVALAEPFESRHRLRDVAGDYRWFDIRASPQFDESRALTEWHSAATELLEATSSPSPRRFLWTADAADGARDYLGANAQAGWPDERSARVTWSDQLAAVFEVDRPAYESARRMLQAGQPMALSYRVLARNGDVLAVDDVAHPVIQGDGAIRMFVGESAIRALPRTEILMIDPTDRGQPLARRLQDAGITVQTVVSLPSAPRTRKTTNAILYCSSSTVADILEMADRVKRTWPPVPLVVLGDPAASPSAIITLHQAGVTDLMSYSDNDDSNVSAILKHTEKYHDFNALDDLPSRAAREAISRLSDREQEILSLAVGGGTSKTIGRALKLSPRTVDYHRGKALDKLGLRTVSQATDLFTPERPYPIKSKTVRK